MSEVDKFVGALKSAEPVCSCPSGDGSLKWPCLAHHQATPCGGCGNADESKRCIGCGHQFADQAEPAPAQDEQQPIATILKADPQADIYDEGPHMRREDWLRLQALPPGTKLYAAPIAHTAPQVPARMEMEPYQTVDRGSTNYWAGWNACRRAMLDGQTAPQPEQSVLGDYVLMPKKCPSWLEDVYDACCDEELGEGALYLPAYEAMAAALAQPAKPTRCLCDGHGYREE